MTEGRDRVG